MSIHPLHHIIGTPIYEPGFDQPARMWQNESQRLEGLEEMMAYYAAETIAAGPAMKPSPPAGELPFNELIAEHYIRFAGER